MVRTPPSQSPELRLLTITEAIEDWIARLGPSVVSIERVFAQDNLRSVIGVAQVMGTAMATAARAGLEVAQHTPSEAKAAVTGSGTADKAQVQAMVTRILGLDAPPRPADAADALALAVCHCWRAPLLITNREAEARAQAQSRHQRGILGQAKQAHHSKHPTTPEELRAQLQTQHLHPRGAWRR